MTSFYYLLVFVLTCVGITEILVYSHIFKIPRKALGELNPTLKKFINCPMCLGYWVGMFINFIFHISNIIIFPNVIFSVLICGFISSATSYAFGISTKYIEDKLEH